LLREGSTKIAEDNETARVCNLAENFNGQRIILGGKVGIERNAVLLLGTVAISRRCGFEVYLFRRCSTVLAYSDKYKILVIHG
jgi:hypothetical protein